MRGLVRGWSRRSSRRTHLSVSMRINNQERIKSALPVGAVSFVVLPSFASSRGCAWLSCLCLLALRSTLWVGCYFWYKRSSHDRLTIGFRCFVLSVVRSLVRSRARSLLRQPRSRNWFLTETEWSENTDLRRPLALLYFEEEKEEEVVVQNVPAPTEEALKKCQVPPPPLHTRVTFFSSADL